MKGKEIILLFFFLLSVLVANSQSPNYNFYNLSTDDGLPTNEYQFVYQDSYGFLWMGSYEGLIRYDGYTMKKYDHTEKDRFSLSHNIVYCIFEDSQKRLWIGTIEGLDLYDRATDSFIPATIRTKGEKIPVNSINEDAQHRLWLGTSFGLCEYNHDKGLSHWYLANHVVFCLTIDSKDNIWTGTFTTGVVRFNPQTKEVLPIQHNKENPSSLSSNEVRSILADHNDQIWVGTADEGITLLNNDGTIKKHIREIGSAHTSRSKQNTVTVIYEDNNQTLWIGAKREPLYYIDRKSFLVKPLNNIVNKSRKQFQSVSSICEDSFGNTWFATTDNGLFYTNTNKNVFTNLYTDTKAIKGLSTTIITCLAEDAHGNIWLGTDGSGLIKYIPSTGSSFIYTKANSQLTSDAITEIKTDLNNNLWITSWGGGLMQFDPTRGKLIRHYLHDATDANSLLYNDAKSLLPDDTLIWVGTHGQGLAAYDLKRNRFIHHHNNNVFSFDLSIPAWINHLYKDKQHRLWISTYSGLFMYDGDILSRYTHSEDTTSISSNSVNMVTQDKSGKIWVISESGGLDQFHEKSKNFIRLTDRYKLPTTMKSILAAKSGKLWISSNDGLLELNPDQGIIKKYDEADGLQGNSFFHKAILQDRNNTIYAGGPRGLNLFHPDSLKDIKAPTYLYTNDLYIYNVLQRPGIESSPLRQVLSFTDELVLNHKQSFFSIEFAALNLYSPSKTTYAYKLVGLHNQWINLQHERKISFTNLDAGHYTLHIKHTGINGEWTEAEKKLSITVLPPWWKTVWFKLLLLTLISGGVLIIFYLRVAAIRQRNIMLKEEVAKRTQELSEVNAFLVERNEEIKLQNERLEEVNEEVVRQSGKILDQQRHISEQNQELEKTVQELQKSNRTKDHFFSILAHDLKNPIAALTGVSDYLNKNFSRLDKKDTHEYLSSIHKSSNAIFDLVVNLLNWSRTQSKNIEYSPIDFNLVELIQKNAALLEQQLNNKHITLTINVDLSHHVFADYNMMDTVIRNLISNSIKFTTFNGEVTITSTDQDGNIVLCIADTGIGMTPEQLDKLFELDKNNIGIGTAGERGTGLGLVITQEFILANKGTIRVSSEPGKGSSFYVSLPKSLTAIKPKKLPEIKPQDASALDFWANFPVDKLVKIKGKKILIVDDNKELRTYLRFILSGTFEIFEAENGQEGLAKALEIQPTVILSDLMMPVMDGLQFCKEIKSSTSTSHIPVIVLTSNGNEESQLSGYAAGADAYLSKPIKKELLIQVILNFIQNQEKMRERMREKILDTKTLQPEDLPLNKLDEEFLNKLIEFIEQNVTDANLDARSICEHLAMSRTVLYTKIKTLTGQSVHEFIKTIRLKRSIKLLTEGKLTISQVALEVGFNSHSYFDKCFVKQYGIGPKDYLTRKKLGKKTI